MQEIVSLLWGLALLLFAAAIFAAAVAQYHRIRLRRARAVVAAQRIRSACLAHVLTEHECSLARQIHRELDRVNL